MRYPWRLFVGLLVIALGYVLYIKHLQLMAVMWHWRNGDSVSVGNYEVPVPRYWLVKTLAPSDSLLTDTVVYGGQRDTFGINVITLLALMSPTQDLSKWKANQESRIKRDGSAITEDRSLAFQDESVECLGSYGLYEKTNLAETKDVLVMHCASSGALQLSFVGQSRDLQVFYSLIPKIKKRK